MILFILVIGLLVMALLTLDEKTERSLVFMAFTFFVVALIVSKPILLVFVVLAVIFKKQITPAALLIGETLEAILVKPITSALDTLIGNK